MVIKSNRIINNALIIKFIDGKFYKFKIDKLTKINNYFGEILMKKKFPFRTIIESSASFKKYTLRGVERKSYCIAIVKIKSVYKK